jgi:hypothetical protein
MGRHTKNGGYVIDWDKVRTFVVPNLENFYLILKKKERERERKNGILNKK